MMHGFEIQIALSRLGYRPGALDGVIGPRTRAALASAGSEHRKIRRVSMAAAAPVLAELVSAERETVPVLTLDRMRAAFPRFAERAPTPSTWIEGLNACLWYCAANEHRAAFLIGQLAHESAAFATLTEYASGAAYEGRADLGNIQPGDGRRYKGRGPIQITGRANYRRVGAVLGIPAEQHPEILAAPLPGFLAAGLYWLDHGLNALADESNLTAITKAINGGLNGLASRQRHTEAAAGLLI